MNISISSNLSEQIANLVRADIDRATETALDRASQVVLNAKRRQVDKTYGRPIPLRKNGTPQWKRSGDLQREQTIQSQTGQRTIGGVGNSEKYEGRLARLNTGADGVNRSNPAAAEAARIVEPQIVPVFEAELKNALGL